MRLSPILVKEKVIKHIYRILNINIQGYTFTAVFKFSWNVNSLWNIQNNMSNDDNDTKNNNNDNNNNNNNQFCIGPISRTIL